MESLFTVENFFGLLALTVLEVIHGIDNILFVSILMGKLTSPDQLRARRIWLASGIITRSLLIVAFFWLLRYSNDIVLQVTGKPVSLRSILLLACGSFLLYKAVKEMHEKLEGEEVNVEGIGKITSKFSSVILQLIFIDLVFSFDTTITAIGLSNHLAVMILSVIISSFLLFTYSGRISRFIKKHPAVKMLGLTFLVMVALVLIIEAWDVVLVERIHLRLYVYFSIGFCLLLELLNIYVRKKKTEPVKLRQPASDTDGNESLFHK